MSHVSFRDGLNSDLESLRQISVGEMSEDQIKVTLSTIAGLADRFGSGRWPLRQALRLMICDALMQYASADRREGLAVLWGVCEPSTGQGYGAKLGTREDLAAPKLNRTRNTIRQSTWRVKLRDEVADAVEQLVAAAGLDADGSDEKVSKAVESSDGKRAKRSKLSLPQNVVAAARRVFELSEELDRELCIAELTSALHVLLESSEDPGKRLLTMDVLLLTVRLSIATGNLVARIDEAPGEVRGSRWARSLTDDWRGLRAVERRFISAQFPRLRMTIAECLRLQDHWFIADEVTRRVDPTDLDLWRQRLYAPPVNPGFLKWRWRQSYRACVRRLRELTIDHADLRPTNREKQRDRLAGALPGALPLDRLNVSPRDKRVRSALDLARLELTHTQIARLQQISPARPYPGNLVTVYCVGEILWQPPEASNRQRAGSGRRNRPSGAAQ